MNKLIQRRKLLKYMQEFGPITTLQAITRLNIMKPSNRVSELKAEGYDIDTEIIWEKKQDGSMTHYAKYSYAGERA